MKTKAMVLAVLMILAAASVSYAEESGNAAVNAIGQILKMPVTMLHKASDSLQNSEPSTAPSEDVAVADVYNLDAETTG